MAKKVKSKLVSPGNYETNRGAIVPAGELAKIRSSSVSFVKAAEIISIDFPQDENRALEYLKQITTKKKEIEKRRKEITQPLNASLKAANALFKEVSTPLTEADGILRDKILAFQRIQQAKADKERERREAIQAAHEAKGHETHALEEVEPDVGVSTVTKRWTYEVVDKKKIPREYLVPHPVAIRTAITNGERDIPGLRIYQQEGLRV